MWKITTFIVHPWLQPWKWNWDENGSYLIWFMLVSYPMSAERKWENSFLSSGLVHSKQRLTPMRDVLLCWEIWQKLSREKMPRNLPVLASSSWVREILHSISCVCWAKTELTWNHLAYKKGLLKVLKSTFNGSISAFSLIKIQQIHKKWFWYGQGWKKY